MRSLTVLLVTLLLVSALPAQTDLSLRMPGYRVGISGPLLEEGGGGFLVAKLDSLPRDRKSARFGVLLRDATTKTPVLEFLDGSTGSSLAKVTSEQWFGRESNAWKRIPELSSIAAGRAVDAFELRNPNVSLTLIRTLERVTAPNLPLGTGLRVTWSVARSTVPSVRLAFRGHLEGVPVVQGRLVTVTSAEKQVPMNAAIMMVWSNEATVRLEGTAPARVLTVQSAAISAASAEAVSVLELTIAGTTSPVSEHQLAQAAAFLEASDGKPTKPQLVSRMVVDRPKAAPGDTVSYRLIYYNVGTAPAIDVELSNPIPEGTVYLPESSAGSNSEIEEEREKVDPPAVGRVLNLIWRFRGNIVAGEARWASFKVIVR